jgi:hypothetical protein
LNKNLLNSTMNSIDPNEKNHEIVCRKVKISSKFFRNPSKIALKNPFRQIYRKDREKHKDFSVDRSIKDLHMSDFVFLFLSD